MKDSTDNRIMIGNHGYYTVSQLADMFDVPEHHFITKVREGELNGQKIGKAYIVSSEQFSQWVLAGNFNYQKRRKCSPDEPSVNETVPDRFCA